MIRIGTWATAGVAICPQAGKGGRQSQGGKRSQLDAERPIARPVWTARSWLPACAQPIKAKLESFMVDDMKYCGLLNETDLTQVQQRIIASGTLTVDEMNTFFLKKK